MVRAKHRKKVVRASTLVGIVISSSFALAACTGTPSASSGSGAQSAALSSASAPAAPATSDAPKSASAPAAPATNAPKSVNVAAPEPPAAPGKGGSRWCTGSDLNLTVDQGHSPTAASDLFVLHLAARPGVTCTIGGTLSTVRWYDTTGSEANVEIGGGQNPYNGEVTVDANHEAAVYFRVTKQGIGLPVSKLGFTLPGKGTAGERRVISWPGAVDGTVLISDIMKPVS
jgi:hypothetical protein